MNSSHLGNMAVLLLAGTSLAQMNVVKNGKFTAQAEQWSIARHGSATGVGDSVSHGVLHAYLAAGSVDSDFELFQDRIPLPTGRTFDVGFDGWSSDTGHPIPIR